MSITNCKNFPVCNLIILLILCLLSYIHSELRFALEMFRHGARSPDILISNNTDLLGEKWEWEGELTSFGMRQHYLLGYKERVYFKDFLSPSYDPNEIYVISTDENRTLMSGQAHLQGLYPPGTGPVMNPLWNDKAVPPIEDFDFRSEIANLNNSALPNTMQVFPIHLLDYSNKLYYLYDRKFCPRASQIFDQRKKGPKEQASLQKFQNLYADKIKKALNFSQDVKFDYDLIHHISDSYISGYTEGRNFTALVNAGINLDEFANFTYEHLSLDVLDVYSGDKEYAIVTKSTAFRDINTWMSTRVQRDAHNEGYTAYSAPKLVLYSIHDRDLGDMFGFLREVFNLTQSYYPYYASSMLFELHKTDKIENSTNIDYEVKIFFNGKLLMSTPFKEFNSTVLSKSYTREQIGDYCGWNETESGSNIYLIIFTIIFGCVALIQLIFIIYQQKKLSSSVSQRITDVNTYTTF